jgi:3-hydroxyisobutyrate dehydrogenase
VFDAVAPALETMTGKLMYLGDDPKRAAQVKLLGNHFIVLLNATLGDTVLLARSMGLSSDAVTNLFEFFNPGSMAPARLKRILEADYDNPTWTLRMARKDVRLMQEAAGSVGLPTISAVGAEMDKLIAEGHGDEDYSVLSKRAVT